MSYLLECSRVRVMLTYAPFFSRYHVRGAFHRDLPFLCLPYLFFHGCDYGYGYDYAPFAVAWSEAVVNRKEKIAAAVRSAAECGGTAPRGLSATARYGAPPPV